jgi:AhpD family alkylhydroperoxidase
VREWSTQERPKWTSREGHFARSLAVMTMTISRLDAARAVPDLYRAMNALDGAVSKSGLDARLQELLKFRVAQMNGCAYCMDMHSRDAIAAGERPERLHVLAGWRAAAGWFDERERAALALSSRSPASATTAFPTMSTTPPPRSSPRPSSAR